MDKAILITGAAGFLGTQVTRLVLEETNRPVIILIRGNNPAAAKLRLERSWWDWPDLAKALGGRIQVLTGDLSKPQLGLDEPEYRKLTETVSHIIHLAADIRLNGPLETLRHNNVKSVQNLLELAYTIQQLHGLSRFSHVSTAYVAGRRTGTVAEAELTGEYGFANHYELTKFEAESLVQAAKADLPISVFRPGMIVGDSQTGAIKTFNTLYFPLRLYLTGKLKLFPVKPSLKINLVPGDYVAEAIVKLTFDARAVGLNFHLTLPTAALPTVRELIHFTRQWALQKLGLQLAPPLFLPFPIGHFQWLRHFVAPKSPVASLLSLASYFEEDRTYRRDNLDRLLGAYRSDWRSFFPSTLQYAIMKGFMHRSGRTVHEQAFFRMARHSRPITYYDLSDGKIIPRGAAEIRRTIEMTAASLAKLAIAPGDRVAIVGFNSTRYLVIDLAVGLSGGVSVPLYYSSPTRELLEIINDCGARIFFVGVPKILEQLTAADVALKIPVISFCRQPPGCSPDRFLDWQRFLTLGADLTVPPAAPVGFGDLATLRYTSGTTGRPKAAAFTHAQLRRMAESLAALPPWQARTNKIRYLSCLPMNHVVEGILAGYALYYAPAPLAVYFLEDFHELPKMAPKVRPTVFFSVPRFYEKIWEKAVQSPLGRLYLQSKGGLPKRLWGSLLRRAVCRAAGIGRCRQLIVGSAPVNTGLLQTFRAIGIEIHNAYGLTEAPLITLNRFQANRIGTVGQPLPETQIRIAPDGEVLVKGPQVMQGYFKNTDDFLLTDGWLHTGDLGSLTDDDYLVLRGRRKEVVIDAYGKNINPVKVELLLREFTGIDQVMLCGNNKPYCTALFWAPDGPAPEVAAAVKAGVQKANQQLSRPEQVKRWAILTDALTISDGDLTANLKMKRADIACKYDAIINALYREERENAGVVFDRID
ncbi:MAG: AMP-binding protein [Bacillota bacterium]|jgi:long-chain acyl-CoA synthetase